MHQFTKILCLRLGLLLGLLFVAARADTPMSAAEGRVLRKYREMAADNPAAAEDWLLRQVEAAPQPALLFELAALRYARKEYDAAARRFGEVFEQAPDFPEVQRNYGQALVMAGRHQDAIEILKPLVQTQGMDARLALLLGDCYMQISEPVAAESCLRLAVIGYPDDLSLRLSLAMALYLQNRYDASEAVIWEILIRAPGKADAWALMANCRLQQKQQGPAIEALEAAIRLAPEQDSRRWLTLGDLYLAESMPHQAARAYRQAGDPDKLEPSRRIALAQALVELDEIAAAREILDGIPEPVRAGHVDVQALLGRIARENEDWQAARGHYRNALEAAPLRGDLLVAMGDLAIRFDEPVAAISYYRSARQSKPWRRIALEAELSIHLDRGDREQALSLLDLLQQDDPQPYWQELRQELRQP